MAINKKKNKSTNPANVIWLGIVSLLTDISSEMIFPVMPLFLSLVLKANMAVIGFIEGLAEGTSAVLKFISGIMVDRFENKKSLTIIGYALSAFSKPFLAVASIWPHVLIVRVLDRFGKGIRTTPRDALIMASVNKKERGKYFGLHRTLDSIGAVIGVALATILLYYLGSSESSYRTIFWLSFIPGFIAVIILTLFVKEISAGKKGNIKNKIKKTNTLTANKKTNPKTPSTLAHFNLLKTFKLFSPDLKRFMLIAALFNLASFSYAFFLLRAQNIGVAVALIPLLYFVYNIFYAASSYPAGKISDYLGRNNVLIAGYLLFALTALGFGFYATTTTLWILFAFYGIVLGFTDGVSRAFVADLADKKAAGTAFGSYHMIIGLTIFPANVVGGLLWKNYSAQVPFLAAAILAVIAACALAVLQHSIAAKRKKTRMNVQNFRIYR
ncbi:TPA: MFS transporter [Candidatus Woesearchaeota archaeon]|nr:MFS transporter [Candidatus Woesearchaeota archaeon]